MGLLGVLLAFDAVLVAVVLAFAVPGVTPLKDWALDLGAALGRAEVRNVSPVQLPWSRSELARVEYEFRPAQGGSVLGASYGDRGQFRAGVTYAVEYLSERPQVNRLQGSRAVLYAHWYTLLFSLLFVPGLLLTVVWLRGAVRLRIALREGRLVAARIAEVRSQPGGPLARVHFTFAAADGREVRGTQHVALRGALGRLLSGARELPLIHDPNDPRVHRLVTPADFLPGTRAGSARP